MLCDGYPVQLSQPEVTAIRGERNGRRIDEPRKYKAGSDVRLPKILLQAHQRPAITALQLQRILKPYRYPPPAWILLRRGYRTPTDFPGRRIRSISNSHGPTTSLQPPSHRRHPPHLPPPRLLLPHPCLQTPSKKPRHPNPDPPRRHPNL